MKTLKEKQLEFLEETINHFNSENRGYNEYKGMCTYSDGCAIGRKLSKELCKTLDKCEGITGVSCKSIFNELPQELRELKQDFLEHIQSLHDHGPYWNKLGLSDIGKNKVNYIKKQFNL
jgi:hypothetical protein